MRRSAVAAGAGTGDSCNGSYPTCTQVGATSTCAHCTDTGTNFDATTTAGTRLDTTATSGSGSGPLAMLRDAPFQAVSLLSLLVSDQQGGGEVLVHIVQQVTQPAGTHTHM